jgi:hypothetical protein
VATATGGEDDDGNFSAPALRCSMLELGVDRVMFSVDWPFVQNDPGAQWMQSLQISAEDRPRTGRGPGEDPGRERQATAEAVAVMP